MRKEVTLLEGGVSGMEIFGLLDQLFHFLAVDFFNLGLCLVGVHRCSNVQLVACVVLNVVTLTHHNNLTQQESNRFKRILSIQIYLIEQPLQHLKHHMWKSIGSIPSPTGRNKEEVVYQPFTQTSRLRLNQSQLSGSQSPQFLQQYFTKKRSPEGLSHRNQSQKSLEVLPVHAPTLSLRDVVSPEPKPKPSSLSSKLKQGHSIIEKSKQMVNITLSHDKNQQLVNSQQIHAQLRKLREEQAKLKKSVQQELNSIKTQMKQTEAQILSRLNQVSSENESKKKQGLNPQVLSKIRQESTRFNDRIRDIQNRKQLVKEKYRLKNQK